MVMSPIFRPVGDDALRKVFTNLRILFIKRANYFYPPITMTHHFSPKVIYFLPARVIAALVVMLGLLAGSVSAQTLTVGPSNVTTNFTSGTNIYTAISIGTAGSNNTLGIEGPGTLITDGGASGNPTVYLGTGGPNNSLIISNGGSMNFAQSRMGGGASGNGNSLIVTGTNSLLTFGSSLN